MNTLKKISVIMCTYNGSLYIEQQINSIIKQTYPIHEFIIQDDNSTDDTIKIIQQFQSQYPYIQLFQNEKHLGINQNFFSAMERATGEFIAISDQDDIWELDKLESQINLISDKLLCSGQSRPFSNNLSIKFPFDERIPNYNLSRLMFASPLPGHTLLFRKTLLSFIPQLSVISPLFMYDVILGITAATQNSIVYVNKTLVHFRRHDSAATYTKPNNYEKSPQNIISILLRTYRLSKELKPIMHERLKNIILFLRSFPHENEEIQKAIKLAETLISDSYSRKAWICYKMRNKILYTCTKRSIVTILQSIYFPIYSYEYIKRFSKKY